MSNYTIGIDPDVDKSGVAVLSSIGTIELHSLRFPQLIDMIKSFCAFNYDTKVCIEAGWLVDKSCFHTSSERGKQRIAKNVGSNHQVGKLICEMLEYYGLNVEQVRPLRKSWSGKNGKITHREIEMVIVGFPKKSNQEERDAALIAHAHKSNENKITSKYTPKNRR